MQQERPKGIHIIIFTRALGRANPGGCTREMKRKYRKGEEDVQRKPDRESKEKEKDGEKRMEEKGLERLKRNQPGRRGNRSLYNKV